MSEFFEEPTPPLMEGVSVSYSSYKTYATCPLQWKLAYVDGLRPFEDSIETIFGTSMHETIQGWLPEYFKNEKHAKSIDLGVILKERLVENFKKSIKEVDGKKVYICDAETLHEYYNDGTAILEHLLKYARDFFPTKGYRLVGCEVPLQIQIRKNVYFKGYLDVVIHDTKLNQYHIIDLKTSRMGWFHQKKDPKILNQILFYKKFYAKQYHVPEEDIFPRFIILKRKIKENPDFIIRHLVKFEPSHGTISMNRATKDWEGFLNEAFDTEGNYRIENLTATPSESNGRYCFARDNAELCPVGWYLKKKKVTPKVPSKGVSE